MYRHRRLETPGNLGLSPPSSALTDTTSNVYPNEINHLVETVPVGRAV